MEVLSETYWDERYKNQSIPWDLGGVSPSIKSYMDQLNDKEVKILIPGAGNSYEAEYLFNQGFKNVYVADLSQTALTNFKTRVPEFPSANLLHSDFFELAETFDLIIEQTFFCALDPKLRNAYVDQCNQLLKDHGLLIGVLFDFPLTSEGPPFGGNWEYYKSIFSQKFEILTLEPCYNSHPSRAGKELFIELQLKD